jgi:general secretion pathway protein C
MRAEKKAAKEAAKDAAVSAHHDNPGMRQPHSIRLARPLATFSLWALALGSAAFWGLRLSAPSVGAPYPPAAASSTGAPDALALGRVLGVQPDAGAPSAPPAAGRFALVGVLAGSSHAGAALIAVDGQPAKPYRVGSTVVSGYVLQSVAPRRAVLGAGTADSGSGGGLTLDMTPLR